MFVILFLPLACLFELRLLCESVSLDGHCHFRVNCEPLVDICRFRLPLFSSPLFAVRRRSGRINVLVCRVASYAQTVSGSLYCSVQCFWQSQLFVGVKLEPVSCVCFCLCVTCFFSPSPLSIIQLATFQKPFRFQPILTLSKFGVSFLCYFFPLYIFFLSKKE